MYSFKQYLSESKNTHLEHLEDEIINNGYQGGVNAVEFLKSLRNMLIGSSGHKVNVSVKWDGAPAVICGVNPENGKFFVGSKSVFNVTPKINYTPADIRKNHTGGLADKLQVALRELRKLNIKGVVQGDFLYTPDEIKTATIRGEKVITFTPNTITYAIPSNSNLASRILKSKTPLLLDIEPAAILNKLSYWSDSNSVNVATPDVSLYPASSKNTELVLLNDLTFTPNLAFRLLIFLPV